MVGATPSELFDWQVRYLSSGSIATLTNVYGPTYDVDGHAAKQQARLSRDVGEDVAVRGLHQFERDRRVMVLQYRLVVIHQRQLRRYITTPVLPSGESATAE